MAETKQRMRFNDEEIALIKNIFGDNDNILISLRKLFLQAPLDDEDINVLKIVSDSEEAIKLLRKVFAPTIELDAPIHQIIDLWMTVENKDKTPAELRLALRARGRLIELIEEGFARFDKTNKTKSSIYNYMPNFMEDDESVFVEYTARDAMLGHVEIQLQQMNMLGKNKEETVEELMARLQKDSNQ